MRDETREEQCEYEVEEDAIEVQSDEEVDTKCTEKETKNKMMFKLEIH